jgi:hypothetical protein
VHFEVVCSKGTYVRSLARDIGTALDTGAHLIALRREAIGENGPLVGSSSVLPASCWVAVGARTLNSRLDDRTMR